MVQFVTLFLALVVGVHPVELAVVGDRVASVELQLDGKRVGEARGEPWIIECDFGEQLRPHTLVAVARDAEGAVVGRVDQRVNVPRSAAELRIMLEGDGSNRRARLMWRSLDGSPPREVTVTLDGTELPGQTLERIELPRFDPKRAHILTAEVEFSDDVRARSEVAFGGVFGETAATELTAVLLQLLRPRKPPKENRVATWLEVDDGPVQIVAVEKGNRDVLMLRDRTAVDALEKLDRKALEAKNLRVKTGHRGWAVPPGVRPVDSLRLVQTTPRLVATTGRDTGLFSVSPDFVGSIPLVLFSDFEEAVEDAPQLFSWSVSSAGSVAAAGKRARALVLVKEQGSPDAGHLPPDNARRYLELLGVPLFVWRPSGPSPDGTDDGWGEGHDISTLRGLTKAVNDLEKSLEAQFVVWIDGDHSLEDVALTEEGRSKVRFAGAPY
jgi:hypothetical protein